MTQNVIWANVKLIRYISTTFENSGSFEYLCERFQCLKSLKKGRGSATEHVLYCKCHRKYYHGSASENICVVALAYNAISVIMF